MTDPLLYESLAVLLSHAKVSLHGRAALQMERLEEQVNARWNDARAAALTVHALDGTPPVAPTPPMPPAIRTIILDHCEHLWSEAERCCGQGTREERDRAFTAYRAVADLARALGIDPTEERTR